MTIVHFSFIEKQCEIHMDVWHMDARTHTLDMCSMMLEHSFGSLQLASHAYSIIINIVCLFRSDSFVVAVCGCLF